MTKHIIIIQCDNPEPGGIATIMKDERGSDLMLGGVGKGFTTGRPRKGLLISHCGKVVLSRGLMYGRDLGVPGKFWFIEIV